MNLKRPLFNVLLLLSVALAAMPLAANSAHAQTATPPPTATPRPRATATPKPATVTAPTRTAVPATAAPAKEPSKEAVAQLPEGRYQQLIGDCDQARRIFASIVESGGAGPVAAEANYRMAQCYLRDEAAAEAFATLKQLLATAPATEAAYRAHLELSPDLQYLAWQRIGAQRQAQGNAPGASEAYRQALAKSPDWTNTSAIRRNLADLALAAGNAKEAVAQYDALRGNNTKGAFASEMQYLAGNALAQVANLIKATGVVTPTYPPEALARWQAAVDADPTSKHAHSSVVALLDAGAPVDEFERGVANYSNGVHELAIAAFDRLRAAEPDGRGGLAWYYAGLSNLALGQLDKGLNELNIFTSKWPDSPQWADALMAKGRALGRADRIDEAVASYREVANRKPDAPQAPKALSQAAYLLSLNAPDQAADAYLELARKYPAADEGWRAYHAAAMTHFTKANWRRAAEIWGEMAAAPKLAAFARPVGYFWQGRALHAAGDREGAARAWQAGVALGETFHGLRAKAWLDGKPESWVREDAPKTEVAPAAVSAGAEKAAISAWLKECSTRASSTARSRAWGIPGRRPRYAPLSSHIGRPDKTKRRCASKRLPVSKRRWTGGTLA